MTEGKELKPKSFRIDDETAERFKAISGSIGGNQQETMAKLIETFEFQSGKAVLAEKKSDIGQFERYVNALTRMYMGSLEDNQNITETVRTEFDALLKSKDTTIQELQEKISVARQVKENAATKARTLADENSRLEEEIAQMKTEMASRTSSMESTIKDKENLNRILTDTCNSLKSRVEESEGLEERSRTFREGLERSEKERKELLQKCAELERQLEQEKENSKKENEHLERKMQVEQEKKIVQMERTFQEKEKKLMEEKQAEIDRYQQKYFELLGQVGQAKRQAKTKAAKKQPAKEPTKGGAGDPP